MSLQLMRTKQQVRVCVCVCVRVCVCVYLSFHAHIHCVLSTFCPCMFDLWLGYDFYCLDCDKMWATNTAVWYYIVVHCGLSGHLWHCKYVNYVGVWSFSCLPFFPPFFLPHPIHSLLSSPRYTALKKIPLRSLCFSSHGMFMCLRAFLMNTRPCGIGSCCQQVCSCVEYVYCAAVCSLMETATSKILLNRSCQVG